MFWTGSLHRRRPSKGRRASAHTPAQVGYSSAIFKIEKPFPTRRSIPISRPWSIFSKCSATTRRPLPPMQSGPLSLNGPSRTAAGEPNRLPLRRARSSASWWRPVNGAGQLRRQKPNPLRQQLYVMLFGLIAATGLRVSEALDLRFDDVLADGVLHIRDTKFGKSRLVPLHPTVVEALDRYLDRRRLVAGSDDHLFPSAKGKRLASSTVNYTFRCVLRFANIAPERPRRPRIHDLRHSFATHVLEQCNTERDAVARHFVALATYLGHVDIKHTYWYLQATPELMTDIAAATETLIMGEPI